MKKTLCYATSIKKKRGKQVSLEHAPEWHRQGLCAGTIDANRWWYEVQNKSYDEKVYEAYRAAEAISICNDCPVKHLCLEEGLLEENLPWGVRGGLLASERIMLVGKQNSYRLVVRNERKFQTNVRLIVRGRRVPTEGQEEYLRILERERKFNEKESRNLRDTVGGSDSDPDSIPA